MNRPEPARTPRSRAAILLFTRGPCAESERKRLPTPGRRAELFAQVMQRLLRAAAGLADVDLIVAAPAWASLPDLPAGAQRLDQKGDSFGQRLQGAVAGVFSLGYTRVAVIGDDAPELRRSDLASALHAVAGPDRQAALGPCEDGGFYLLALNRPETNVLEQVPWCSGRTAQVVRRGLQERGFRTTLLRRLADIDDAPTLQLFLGRVRRAPDAWLRSLAAWIDALLRAALQILRAPPLLQTAQRCAFTVPARRGPPVLACI